VHLQKAYTITILISLAAHMAVLSMPLIFRSQSASEADAGIVTVELKKSFEAVVESRPETEEPAKQGRPVTARGTASKETHEETVTLGNRDSRYQDYLKKVKSRIDGRWSYPGKAFERGEKGITTLKFSIDSDGSLSGNVVMGSSGYALLDECALNVVRAAAPYDPLPREYSLTRLHIIASFHYNIGR
jgi:TonB family protein